MRQRDQEQANELAKDYKDRSGGRITEITLLSGGGSGYIFTIRTNDGELRALKIIRPDQVDEDTLNQGFIEEAKLLCLLDHPNIVKAYTAEIIAFPSVKRDLPVFEMEYLPSGSLDQALPKGSLNPDFPTLLTLLRQVLAALEYLHQRRPPTMHLDVKEANLLLDLTDAKRPVVKLSDFGLAKEVSLDAISTEVRGSLPYWPMIWQKRLQNQVPTNNNRAIIRLPRKDIPVTVDLHMLGVTLDRILSAVPRTNRQAFWYRALLLVADKLNWDQFAYTTDSEKYSSSSAVLTDLARIESPPTLPTPLTDDGSLCTAVRTISGFGTPLRKLVDNPWFQRLRRIRQLGVAHLVYPGATHTRFEHSLGAYGMALQYLSSLRSNHNSPWFLTSFSDDESKALALCMLLHDLGHYPFSHQLEELHGWPSHESMSYSILAGAFSQDHPTLVDTFGDPAELVRCIEDEWRVDRQLFLAMFAYCYRDHVDNINLPKSVPRAWRAAAEIVNGPIDADKRDYLERDAKHTGASCGTAIATGRFLASLTIACDEIGAHLAVSEKGRVAAEFIAVDRYAMFGEVYWHHTVRSLTSMLRRSFQIARGWSDSRFTLENLFKWSDDRMLREAREDARRHRDANAARLVEGIWHRNPYARVFSLGRRDNANLFAALSVERVRFMTGANWLRDKELVKDCFGVAVNDPSQLLWDIPDPGKEKIRDVIIADAEGAVLANTPGPLWESIAANFTMWVRKIRLFVSPEHRPENWLARERIDRERKFSSALASTLNL